MAELQDIIARIEQESQERCNRLQEQAQQKSDEESRAASEAREKWLSAQIEKADRDSRADYRRKKAALEQDYRKKTLQARQKILHGAMEGFYARLEQIDQNTFNTLLGRGMDELGGQGVFGVEFGVDAPSHWADWAKEFTRENAKVEIVETKVPRALGFVISQNFLSYRFIADQLTERLLQDKGDQLDRILFAEEV